MQIIQNIATIDLPVNPADKHINFDLNRLYGKKINAIFFSVVHASSELPGIPVGPGELPPDPNPLDLTLDEIKSLSLFLTLVDIQGDEFIQNLSVENLLMNFSTPEFCELKINRVLDIKKSGIDYKANPTFTVTKYLKMYILYQEENFNTFSDNMDGSITFFVNAIQTDSLYSIVGDKLNGKKIKRIRTNLVGSLNLIGENNTIENLVNGFMPYVEFSDIKSFWFDQIEFDYKKSYWNQSGAILQPFIITFIF